MAGEGQKSAPVILSDTPDLKKVLDTADKNEAVKELQRQLNSERRFEKVKELLRDTALRDRMRTFLNDPNLKETIPGPIRTSLNRIISELEGVSAARNGLRNEMAAQGIVPPAEMASRQADLALEKSIYGHNLARPTELLRPDDFKKTAEFLSGTIDPLVEAIDDGFSKAVPEGFDKALQDLFSQSDWKVTIGPKMKNSVEYRIKICFLAMFAPLQVQMGGLTTEASNFIQEQTKPYANTFLQDFMKFSNLEKTFNAPAFRQIAGENITPEKKTKMVSALLFEMITLTTGIKPLWPEGQVMYAEAMKNNAKQSATPPATAATPNPNAPATPAQKPPEKPVSKDKSLADMSFSELFKGLIDNLGGLFASIGQLMGGASSAAKPAEKAAEKAAPKFTEAQLKAIQLALEKNKETKYPGQEKAAEYVCDALGLPRMDSPQVLLENFKNSEMEGQKLVFNQEISNLKNLKNGDVIFFRKDVNQSQPHLCAVVSKTTAEAGQERRVYVKTIGAGGGQPQEMEVIGDLRSQFYGAVQIPHNQPAAGAAPASASQ